jgi:hypothetical protein
MLIDLCNFFFFVCVFRLFDGLFVASVVSALGIVIVFLTIKGDALAISVF